MRKLLIVLAAVTAVAALPASANAAGPPETCDVIKNTMCHWIPPDHVPTGCEIADALGFENVRECENTATSRSAAPAGPPETCDIIRNTICHLIPPKSVADVCAIVDAISNLSCDAISVQEPVLPDVNSCKYLANTACQYLPPTSVEDVCGLLEATRAASCTISRR